MSYCPACIAWEGQQRNVTLAMTVYRDTGEVKWRDIHWDRGSKDKEGDDDDGDVEPLDRTRPLESIRIREQ